VRIIFCFFAFLFGLVIGSFMNVLMYRIPNNISIIKPNSFCPKCKKPIRWYENIPLVSYITLGGKCSKCQAAISIRYPIVELITGIVFLYFSIVHGLNLMFLFNVVFFCILIVISGIDLWHQDIYDVFPFSGIVLGLLYHLLYGSILVSIAGGLFGGGFILLIRVIGGKVYKKEVMGMGDVFLTAMIGAFVGFPFIIAAIFFASLVGAILGILYVISTQQSSKSPIPFGPFLSIGGMIVIIFKPEISQLFQVAGIYSR